MGAGESRSRSDTIHGADGPGPRREKQGMGGLRRGKAAAQGRDQRIRVGEASRVMAVSAKLRTESGAGPAFGLPNDTAPMEAQSAESLPTGDAWQYEPKWDGFRCLAFKQDDAVDLR